MNQKYYGLLLLNSTKIRITYEEKNRLKLKQLGINTNVLNVKKFQRSTILLRFV